MKLLHMNIKSMLLVSVIGICLVLSVYSVHAQNQDEVPIPKPNFSALTQQTNAIVIGQPVSISSRLTINQYGDQIIVSDVNFELQEVLKGQLQPGQTILFKDSVGGKVNEVTMISDEAPFFKEGERSLLFIENISPNPSLLFGELGKYDIDSTNQIPKLGQSLDEVRTEILSFLANFRIFLPLITNSNKQLDVDILHDRSQLPVEIQAPRYVLNNARWSGNSPTIRFEINNPGFNDATSGTVNQQNTAIANAANTWGVQGRGNFAYQNNGTTTISATGNDGTNAVIVRNAASDTALATATWWLNNNNELTDCDIVFWDQNFAFSTDGQANTFDIQSVVTHEFGHCLGLGHSPVNSSTMFSFTNPANTSGRTLHLDDQNGVRALYGARQTVYSQTPAGANESSDLFSSALATGDFNGDGINDLAVGAPGEDLNNVTGPNAGAIFIFLGSGSGLGTPVVLGQDAGANESGDRFGSSLVSGDFNNDGFDDLAIGTPGEDYQGSGANAGVVFLFFGSGSGLGNAIVFGQDPAGANESGDLFGSALAVGDFDNNGIDDLAVGSPGEDLSNITGPNAGAIFIFLGSNSGLGTPVVLGQQAGADESGDRFGSSLASGDFNNDGFDDLAIGTPGEDYQGSGANAGVVYLFFGSGSGLGNATVFGQDPAGANESGDLFGSALAVGDFDNNGIDDLAVGSPGEDLFNVTGPNAGAVFMFSGSVSGLGTPYVFGQDAGANESGDRFGSALVAGDFNNDGFDDLAIGTPGEDYRGSGANAGVVFIRQFNDDFVSADDYMGVFGQDAGANESGDRFGSVLAVGDFNHDGAVDLAIGSPGEDFQGSGQNAGVIFLWH